MENSNTTEQGGEGGSGGPSGWAGVPQKAKYIVVALVTVVVLGFLAKFCG